MHKTTKVLGYIDEARRRGVAVIFITHNLYHVYLVADKTVVPEHRRKAGDFRKEETCVEDPVQIIASGMERTRSGLAACGGASGEPCP